MYGLVPDDTVIDPLAWLAANRDRVDRGEAGPLHAGELTVLLVVGRGPRGDFHVNSVDELFYQLEGAIEVVVGEGIDVHTVRVGAGELWVAPAGVPHSPQRPAGTIGLVVERRRPPGSTEAFRWFCRSCGAVVHEIVLDAPDPVAVRDGIRAFHANEAARTCRACGQVVPLPGR